MLERFYKTQECSAARALEVAGERWSLLILRNAMFAGHVKFSEFERSLGVSTNILAKRLESFVVDGLMNDVAPSSEKGHREYHLTDKGRDLMPAIIALTEWGDKWVGPGPVEFMHKDCGGHVRLCLCCTQCEGPVTVDQVEAAKVDQAT